MTKPSLSQQWYDEDRGIHYVDSNDDLAKRIDALGRRIAMMPFGEPDSQQRRERDRLCDGMNALAALLHKRRQGS